MKYKYNPFRPNSPVFKGMFVGRVNEIKRMDEVLFQTKNGNPTHLMIVGERGIGKSSLLLVANYIAKGDSIFTSESNNFLTVQLSLECGMQIYDFALKLNNVLSRELNKENKALSAIKKIWGFIKTIQIAGSGITNIDKSKNSIMEKLTYSIADTVKALTTQSALTELGLKREKEGLVILVDEVDNASKELNFGGFLKNLTELLVLEECNKLLFVIAGLPNVRDILRESHESSLRLFEELELKPLSKDEVSEVIVKGINEYQEKCPSEELNITQEALDSIFLFSEGYPHFVQQIGYSTLQSTKGDIIDESVVKNATIMTGGAIDLIGDRYFEDLFFNRIKVDSYRSILLIMAENWNDWISKKDIKKNFKGKDSTLDNGLKALRDRNIILTQKGTRGMYRLQWASFAFWISLREKRSYK
jgi:Cdc6-like AAA superfamily ATPase